MGTDLEIEFEEALEADVNNSYDEKTASNETENENVDEIVSEERESSSSMGLSDIDCGYRSSDKVKKAEIDGALLKKLGVPLDYNEQNQLATMIVENRNLDKENESRFDDKTQQQNNNNNDDNNEEEKNENDENEKEEKQDTICDGDLSPIGPDDVKCENCGKWVHSMSIQMHTVHCIRQYIKCKECKQVIRRQDEEQHFVN